MRSKVELESDFKEVTGEIVHYSDLIVEYEFKLCGLRQKQYLICGDIRRLRADQELRLNRIVKGLLKSEN